MTLAILAVWVIGMENCCEYWMNACTSPMVIARCVARMPPATAIAT